MIKNDRIDEILNHLEGSRLQLSSVLTSRERDDIQLVRKIYEKMYIHPESFKWTRKKDVTA